MGGFHDLSWNIYEIPVDTAAQPTASLAGTHRSSGRWAGELPRPDDQRGGAERAVP